MRRLLVIALLASAGPAFAQGAAPANKPTAYETYRSRTVTVYGNDACPKPLDPEEIVVCARRPEEERYRFKQLDDDFGARVEEGGTDRTLGAMDASNAGGPGSCSTVGPNGSAGCSLKFVAREKKVRKREEAIINEKPPEQR
jgi:hypothetical protein